MIKTYKNTIHNRTLKEVSDFASLGWTCVSRPSEEEMEILNKKLGVSIETLHDCLDENELPRIKTEKGNLIVTLRAAVKDSSSYSTTPITLILNKGHITTISTREVNVINDLKSKKVKIYTTQHSNFLINFCLSIISYFQEHINAINRDVRAKKRIMRDISQNDVLTLVETEEILNSYISALVPNINVIKKILNLKYINFYENDRVLIDDLSVDAEQVLNLAENNLRTVNNIREGYTTVLSIRRNQIIKMLTYITAFLTIPMAVGSVYGMNIKLPYGDSPYIFNYLASVTLGIMLLALIIFVVFRKKL